MNKADKLKARLLAGPGYHNFAFSDAVLLLNSLGFAFDHIRGGHHWFKHPRIPQPVNLQPIQGQCKPYQLRQIRDIIREHNL